MNTGNQLTLPCLYELKRKGSHCAPQRLIVNGIVADEEVGTDCRFWHDVGFVRKVGVAQALNCTIFVKTSSTSGQMFDDPNPPTMMASMAFSRVYCRISLDNKTFVPNLVLWGHTPRSKIDLLSEYSKKATII